LPGAASAEEIKKELSVKAFASIPPDENTRIIAMRALEDSSVAVKKAAIAALGSMAGKEFLDDLSLLKCLAPMLEDKDKGVKKAAIRALGKIKNERVAVTLADILENTASGSSAWIKYEIIRVLEKHNSERIEQILINQLIDGDILVQIAACEALGKTGGAKARAALKNLQRSENRDIGDAAKRAAESIEKRVR